MNAEAVHADAVTRDEVEAAAERLGDCVRSTPVIEIPLADLLGSVPSNSVTIDPATTLVLKLEYLQHSGTFKARGARHAIATRTIGSGGVVAASGGNHGAAVAWAAAAAGHPATIFVPEISAPAKVERLRSFGADVHQVGAVYQEALEASTRWLADHEAVAIHAYDDPAVVAGAGTCARELDHQAAPLDAVLVACGGGGLSGGAAAWFGERTGVVACETGSTATYAAAVRAGRPTRIAPTGVAADALGATTIGAVPWVTLRAAGARSATVTDEELLDARWAVWERLRIVLEPSAAAPIAVLRSGRWTPSATTNGRLGVVLCGANTDPAALSRRPGPAPAPAR